MTRLFVAKETRAGERRVAASPESVQKLVAAGLEARIGTRARKGCGSL